MKSYHPSGCYASYTKRWATLIIMKLKKTATLLLILFSFSCSYYNDTIEWADNIKTGTSLTKVQMDQPDFLQIDWNNPEIDGDKTMYLITNIKGNKDPLGMSHYLLFIDGEYQGRIPHK